MVLFYWIGEAAVRLGVCTKTIRRWDVQVCLALNERLLYCSQFDGDAREKIEEMAPEILKFGVYGAWEEGVPTPKMTLECQLPNMKDKRIYKEENFEWHYPEGCRITLGDVGMELEDALDGFLTNLTEEFPLDQRITRQNIISKGMGLLTELYSD